MLRMSRIFNFLKKRDQNFRKIREHFGNVQIIQKIIQNYSVVSLSQGPEEVRVACSERAGLELAGSQDVPPKLAASTRVVS